jgi:hypothetical protein
LPVTDKLINIKFRNIVSKLRDVPARKHLYPSLYLVREEGGSPQLKIMFLSHLIEDRHDFGPSYAQFLNEIREKVNKS